MKPGPSPSLDVKTAVRALLAAWQPFLVYELVMSLVSAFALGPLALAVSYALLRFSGESVFGNWELFRFFLTPLGLVAILLGAGTSLGIAFIEYSGLFLLAAAALTGQRISVSSLVTWIARSALRLVALALLQTALAMLAAVPFLLAAGGIYWLLLSGSDINFYLAERPPRFWIAATAGGILCICLTATCAWFFVQWLFAVPLCLAGKTSWWGAMRASARLIKGRAWRLFLLVTVARLIEELVLIVALATLNRSDHWLLSRTEGASAWLLWSTMLILLFDAIVIEMLSAVFAVALASVIAFQYLQAQPSVDSFENLFSPRVNAPSAWPAWSLRIAVVSLLALGPALSIVYAVTLEHHFADKRPHYVTAHRAGPKAAPENSLAALRLGLAAGADFVEVDVQLTADGHVVLLHDKDLRRVTGDPRSITNIDLAQAQSLPLLLDGRPTEGRIPRLDEFLAACDDQIRINVELKADDRMPELPLAVLDVLRRHDFVRRAVVSCFDLPPLLQLHQTEPALPIGMILSAAKGDMTTLPVDFLSLNHRLVTADVVRRAHARGQEVHAWTVNDRQVALRLLDYGCDNLITSDPAAMREVVDWYTGLGELERMLLRVRCWLRR